jgi:hypothetical protein
MAKGSLALMTKQNMLTCTLRSIGLYRVGIMAILAWALLIRLMPLIWHGRLERYHSGGLFFAFVEAIRADGFHLPQTIPNYTLGGLPFVYPPLAFYLTALVNALLGVGPGLILVMNIVFSFGAVIAFAFTIHKIELSPGGRLIALLAFATMPQGFLEHLPGEGLAESLGTLSFVLLLFGLVNFESNPSWKNSFLLGVISGVNVLSSPGTAVAAPITVVIFFVAVLFSENRPLGAIPMAQVFGLVVAVSVLVAGPYLLHIESNFGFASLLRAMRGQEITDPSISMLSSIFTLVPLSAGIPYWHILALYGLVYAILSKKFFWALWPLFIAAIPREGIWLITLPVSVLAAFGVAKILVPFVEGLSRSLRKFVEVSPLAIQGSIWVFLALTLGFLVPIRLLTLIVGGGQPWLYASYVTRGEANHLEQIRTDSPADLKILIVGDENEWAPQLAQRTVLNVWYGTEWAPEKAAAIDELNDGLSQARDAQDVAALIYSMADRYPQILPAPDRLYISKQNRFTRHNPVLSPDLIQDLRTSQYFNLEFENADVIVFSLKDSPATISDPA